MKKTVLLLVVSTLISGCAFIKNEEPKDEVYNLGTTLSDGRVVHSTFEVRYNNDYLMNKLSDESITIDEFVEKLKLVDEYKDGGSKLYKYEDDLKFSGLSTYYVLKCDSLDNIRDVYIAKSTDTFNGLCSLKIDDLEGVSMKVKEGTVSNKGLTVIITDTSDRENIYGTFYRIDVYKNGEWVEVNRKSDMAFTSIGLYPDENNTLELDISWLNYYGRLSSGRYRVVKSTSVAGEGTEHFITAEFKIK